MWPMSVYGLRRHVAGMMPIPYAFNLLGWVLGSAMLVSVALMTYWTKATMVEVGRAAGALLLKPQRLLVS